MKNMIQLNVSINYRSFLDDLISKNSQLRLHWQSMAVIYPGETVSLGGWTDVTLFNGENRILGCRVNGESEEKREQYICEEILLLGLKSIIAMERKDSTKYYDPQGRQTNEEGTILISDPFY